MTMRSTDTTTSGTPSSGATTTPDLDFYTPPALNSSHRPGDILRLRPTATPGLVGAGPAWQILYTSSDTRGDPIPASGTVITPDGVEYLGAGPILVYHPSFHGLGTDSAASRLLAAGSEPDADRITAALARGWRVAVVDGEGLGVLGSGPHTFLAGRAAGQVVLDLARAATRIPALHAAQAPIVVWGYAEGGRAAVAAGGIQPGYAPELTLRAIAAGAVITDPEPFLRQADTSPWPALGLAALIGLSHAHRHLPLRHVFTEPARWLLTDAEAASWERLSARYQHRVTTWCERPDPWNDPLWHHVLALESLRTTGVPAVPVSVYHGRADAIVPIEFGRRLSTDLAAAGTPVHWREYDTDHVHTPHVATDAVLAHLAADLTEPTRASPRAGAPSRD